MEEDKYVVARLLLGRALSMSTTASLSRKAAEGLSANFKWSCILGDRGDPHTKQNKH
jgi:hypothetical protein